MKHQLLKIVFTCLLVWMGMQGTVNGQVNRRDTKKSVPYRANYQRMAGGGTHTLEIRNGTLWAWGGNGSGQLGDGSTTDRLNPTKIGTDDKWVSIAGGDGSSFGLKSNGTLWAWGGNGNGQLGTGDNTNRTSPVQIGSDDKWLSVTSSYYHTQALRSDGTLWAWGWNSRGQLGDGTDTDRYSPVQIGTDNKWVSIDAGQYYTLALKSDGTLWGWGHNSQGQLGDSTTTTRTAPVQIGLDADWVGIATGDYHSIGLKSDGTLWGWGFLKANGSSSTHHSPVQIGTDNKWVNLAASEEYTLCLKSDGSLWSCGNSYHGELGDGTNTDRSSLVQIGTDNKWVAISAGGLNSNGLKSDGTLWAWGYNNFGQLGDGTTTERDSPVKISIALNVWLRIEGGGNHSIGLKSDGSLWAWGDNTYGQLGTGNNSNQVSPVKTGIDDKWVSVSVRGDNSLGLKSDGTLWGWGYNFFGELGDGTNIQRNSPIQIGSDNNWVSISRGSNHSLGLKSDGTIWSWGSNSYGQLGDSTNTDQNSPHQMGTDSDWIYIVAGEEHSFGLKSNGTLWAWGWNGYGQLGDGTTTNSTYPLKVGTDSKWISASPGFLHSLGLKSDGSLWAWGGNQSGELGDGTTTDRANPVKIGTDTTWINIEAGAYHSLGLKSGGTLWGWGDNTFGELGDGTNTTRHTPAHIGTDTTWVSLAAEGFTSLGLKSDGNQYCGSGYNQAGQLGDGTTTNKNSFVCNTNISIPPQNVLYVDSSITTSGNGKSWATVYKTLQEALNYSSGDTLVDTIRVAKGTYHPYNNRDSSFVLVNGVVLEGGYPNGGGTRNILANPTILDGNVGSAGKAYHVVTMLDADSTTVLDGFSIVNGKADSISNKYIYGHTIPNYFGGGLYNSAHYSGTIGNPLIINCTFKEDSASYYGGAIYNDCNGGNCTPEISNCVFSYNGSAFEGGAIYNYGRYGNCSPTMTRCTFNDNGVKSTSGIGTGGGGAIWNDGIFGIASPTFIGCDFVSNKVSVAAGGGGTSGGGAIHNEGFAGQSNPVFANCSFASNTSNYDGGAIFNFLGNDINGYCNPSFTNCTFFKNSAKSHGQTMMGNAQAPNSTQNTITLNNCIIWQNDSYANGNDALSNNNYGQYILNNCILQGDTSSYNIHTNGTYYSKAYPNFADTSLAIPDLHLTSASVNAINKGDSTLLPPGITTDIEGNARVQQGQIDIGAYESQYNASSSTDCDSNWVYKQNMPSEDAGICSAVNDSEIYILGGHLNHNRNISYNSKTNTWTTHADVPAELFRAMAASVNGKIYVFGTLSGSNLDSVYEYNPATDTWARKTNMPTGRVYAAITVYNNKIYVMGGDLNGSGNWGKVTEVYDPSNDTWQSKADMPGENAYFNGCTLNNKIYVFGGTVDGKAVYQYEPGNNTWSTLQQMPFHRIRHSVAVANSKIYIIAGQNANGDAVDSVYIYNPVSQTWSIAPNLHIARIEQTAQVANGTIYVFGGAGYNYGDITATTEALCTGPTSCNPMVTLNANPGYSNICPGTNITFKATPSNAGASPTYNFLVNGSSVQNSVSDSLSSSSFSNGDSIRVVITSHSGCPNDSTASSNSIVVSLTPPPFVGSASISSNLLCSGNTVNLGLISYSGTLQWQANSGSGWNNIGSPNTNPLNNIMVNMATQYRAFVTRCSNDSSNVVSVNVYAHKIYVDSSITSSGDGSSWGNAYKTLSEAIALSQSCSSVDSILVAKGTYYPAGSQSSTDRDSSFYMRNGLAILGGYPVGGGVRDILANQTILSGNIKSSSKKIDNSYHILVALLVDSTGILDGFTIKDGNANFAGSRPYQGYTLWGYNGGGIYCFGKGSGNKCTPTISNCIFMNNEAIFYGGAVYNDGAANGNSSPIISQCRFISNSTQYGGGAIYNAGSGGKSSPNIITSSFMSNTADLYGGAIYNDGSNGISSSAIINCEFKSNLATQGNGGAIFDGGYQGLCTPIFTNCSFYKNNTPNDVGQTIYGDYNSGNSNNLATLNNCIVWLGNAFGTVTDALAENNGAYTLNNCILQEDTNQYNIHTNGSYFSNDYPAFADSSNVPYSLSLTQSSANAINKGNSSLVPAGISTDLAGNTRFVGSSVDIGAYELPCINAATGTASASDDSVCSGTSINLTLTSYTGVLQWQVNSGSGWNNIGSVNTNPLNNITVGANSSYRAYISGTCATDSSNIITVIVHPATMVGAASSSDSIVCTGGSVNLSLGIYAGSLQWQVNSGNGWNNIGSANTNPLNNITVNTPSDYRAYITGTCSNDSSNIVSVSLYVGTSVGTAFSSASTVCAGSSVNLAVNSYTGTLQWQKNTGGGWINIGSVNTTPLNNITVSTPTDYRAYVTGTCSNDSSNVVSVSLYASTSVGTASSSASTVCTGNSVNLSLTSYTGSLQWQANTGSGWNNIGSVNTNPLNSITVNMATDYRAYITGTCSNDSSNIVSVSLYAATAVGTASSSASTVCTGSSVNLSLTSYTGTLQWQSNSGTGWNNIGSVNTNPLNSITVNTATNYRAYITGTCSNDSSNVVSVSLYAATAVGTASSSATTVCPGNSINLSLTSYTGTLQWQTNTGSGWNNIGSTNINPLNNITVNTAADYRAYITGTCSNDSSNIVSVSFYAATTVGTASSSATTVCIGSTINLSLTAYTGVLQWQTNTGSGWNNIGSVNTNPLNNLTVNTASSYRAYIMGSCSSDSSNIVSVSLYAATSVGTASSSATTVCAGTTINLSSTPYTGSLQWQKNTGGGWSNIGSPNANPLNNVVVGVPTDYRTYITGTCSNDSSNIVSVSLYAATAVGTASSSASSICTGGNVNLSLTSYAGSLQWQKNTGSGWINIGSPNTNPLNNISLTVATNYRAYITGTCNNDSSNIVSVAITPATAVGTASSSVDSICPGSPFNLTLTSFTGSLQWQANTGGGWSNIGSSNPQSTSITAASSFRAYITGTCSNDSSNTVNVTLKRVPLVGTASSSATNVCYNATVNLSLTSWYGTLQWQKNTGSGWTNVGSTNVNPLNNQTISADVKYRAWVTTSCGPDSSNIVQINAYSFWTGAIDTNWLRAANWCPSGIPTSAKNVFIPSGLSTYPSLSGFAFGDCNNLVLQNGSTLKANGSPTLTVNGKLTNGGTVYCFGGTIIYTSADTLPAISYYHLSLNATSGNYIMGSNASCVGNLSLTGASASLNTNGYTFTVGGSLTNNGTISGNGKILLSNATTGQNIFGTGTLSNLELNLGNSALAVSVQNNCTVLGTLTLTSGQLYIQNNVTLTVGSSSTANSDIICAAGMCIRANSSNTTSILKILGNGSAPVISSLIMQSSANLYIDRPAGAKLGGNSLVGTAITLVNGRLDQNAYSLNCGFTTSALTAISCSGGRFTNSGASGTLSILGSNSAAAISGFKADTLNGVSVGIPAGLSLGSNLYLTGLFNISSGNVHLNGKTVALNANASLSEAAGQTFKNVTGKLTTTRNFNSALSAVNVGGMGLVLTTSAAPGNTVIDRTHAQFTSGTGNSILRQFSVTPTAASTATLTLNYDASELNGGTAARMRMNYSTDNGSNWNTLAGGMKGNYFVTRTSVSLGTAQTLYTLSDSVSSPLMYYGLIKQNIQGVNILVYPNPSTGIFNIHIETESDEPVKINISDINGRYIKTITSLSKEMVLDADLAAGIYYAEIMQGKMNAVVRLVKIN